MSSWNSYILDSYLFALLCAAGCHVFTRNTVPTPSPCHDLAHLHLISLPWTASFYRLLCAFCHPVDREMTRKVWNTLPAFCPIWFRGMYVCMHVPNCGPTYVMSRTMIGAMKLPSLSVGVDVGPFCALCLYTKEDCSISLWLWHSLPARGWRPNSCTRADPVYFFS